MSDLDRLMDLVKRRLVHVRYSADGSLALFKYHRKVFYDSLWGEDPMLLQARGHVYDVKTGNLVVNPFDKVFNYGERGAGLDTPNCQLVMGIRKVNGFMAAATWCHGKLLVTTTGSFESPFVDLAWKYLAPHAECLSSFPGRTHIFEICDPSDPHVIPEKAGAYFLAWRIPEPGSRTNADYDSAEYESLQCEAVQASVSTFKVAVNGFKDAEDEGGMIYDPDIGQFICKVKSKRYLALKLMGRSKKFFETEKTKKGLYQALDEKFYPLVDFVFDDYGQERFRDLPENEKLDLLRSRL